MRSRSWRWLKLRIEGLFGVERSRLRLHFYPPKKQSRKR